MNKIPLQKIRKYVALGAISLSCVPSLAVAGENRVLVIGDSHSAGTFGRTLDQVLRAKLPQAKISTYASSSATPEFYFRGTPSHGGFYKHLADGPAVSNSHEVPETETPKLPLLLDEAPVRLTVVALGTNLLRGASDFSGAQIAKMIRLIRSKGSQCVWVGPPDERFVSRAVQEKFYGLLRDSTGSLGCQLIDSRNYTHYPDQGGGGIHYDDIVTRDAQGRAVYIGTRMAREWGEKVAADVVQAMAKDGD